MMASSHRGVGWPASRSVRFSSLLASAAVMRMSIEYPLDG
jgi:hypothetical protein